MFILHADKNNLKIEEKEMVTSGSVNIYTCRFVFNHEWDNLDKTAVFKCSETTVAVELSPVFDDDSKEYIFETNIPWEVMQEYGRTLYIGVRGTQGENLVLPTIWASAGTIKQGVLPSDAGTDIPPNKYDELKADISKKGDKLEYNGIDLSLLSEGQIISTVPIVGNVDPGDITTGVLTFNGRNGRVVPEKGDYTAEMVGALPNTTPIPSMPEDIGAASSEELENAINKINDEIIENLDNKLDTTGGTVTGEITFSDSAIARSSRSVSNNTTIDSTGIHYNGTGTLQIEENGLSVIDEIKSEIPKNTSQLENDSGYITQEDIPFIPTKISQLENDRNFVDEQYVQEVVSNIQSGGIGGGNIPNGCILIWSGEADSVPEGWVLCDGTNGTPDLRDKFVLGAGTSYAVGATGGEEKVTLSVEQMPEHRHNMSCNFGGAIATTGRNVQLLSAGSINYTGNDSYVGGSQSHNNMPPYYTLCYIMKL